MLKRNEEILAELTNLIQNSSDLYLPSISTLSKKFRCRTKTISKLCHELAQQGLLSIIPRQKIRIEKKFISMEKELSVNVEERIKLDLRKDIASGKYRIGDPIEKYAFFKSKYCISLRGLQKIFRQMQVEKLIYKDGKKWRVGQYIESKEANYNVLLIVLTEDLAWQRLSNPLTQPMITAICREASVHSTSLILASLDSKIVLRNIRFRGLTSILDLIYKYKNQLLGVLLVGDDLKNTNLQKSIQTLSGFSFPLIALTRTYIDNSNFPISKNLFRIRFEEENVIQQILKHCSENNHSVAGFISVDYSPNQKFDKRPEWQIKRQNLLKELGQKKSERPMKVISSEEKVDLFCTGSLDAIFSVLDNAQKSNSPTSRRVINIFASIYRSEYDNAKVNLRELSKAISMWYKNMMTRDNYPAQLFNMLETYSLLLDPSITILIFPNDDEGLKIYSLLIQNGFEIPDEISLISVDNKYDPVRFPVDSVDKGSEKLGYLVFHKLYGLIPVENSKENEIKALPQVFRYGSVKKLPLVL